MSPRLARRAKMLATASKKAKDNVAYNGKCKFIELPAELLLEIVSFFPAVHIPTSRHFNTPVLPPSVFERWDVLRALSQTCRLWRNIFFPMLWERMEACAVRSEIKSNTNTSAQRLDMADFSGDTIPVGWYKGVSRSLERVSLGLTGNPEAANHVRTVNVSLTRCSPRTVLPAFVKCLENLPNLYTLQILRAHTQMTTMLKNHFSGHTFPTVHTVIIPDHGHEILRCCPETRKVICNNGDGSKLVTAIAKCCKKIEVIEGIDADKNILKRLVKACPNLRELTLDRSIERSTEALAVLSVFKNLRLLELRTRKDYADTFHRDPVITQAIALAKGVLNNNKSGEQKILRLRYDPGHLRPDEKRTITIPI